MPLTLEAGAGRLWSIGVAVLLSSAAATAQVPASTEPPSAPGTTTSQAMELSIPDVPVITQDGKRVRFYADLVENKVVAINFIFTTCTTICPPLGVTFAKVQDLLGDRLGGEAHLISISVDPVTDTPPRLKAWADKFGARPGWTLITGTKPDMDRLLRALNAGTAQPEQHSPMVLVGNDARRSWTRVYGLAPAATLTRAIEEAMTPLAEGAPPSRASEPR